MAADLDDKPSLVKMLLTWRATVFSLMNRSSAIARLVFPVATDASTCTSRAVRPPTARAEPVSPLHERLDDRSANLADPGDAPGQALGIDPDVGGFPGLDVARELHLDGSEQPDLRQ